MSLSYHTDVPYGFYMAVLSLYAEVNNCFLMGLSRCYIVSVVLFVAFVFRGYKLLHRLQLLLLMDIILLFYKLFQSLVWFPNICGKKSGKCLRRFREMLREFPGTAREVSRTCPGSFQGISGKFPDMSGKCPGHVRSEFNTR